MLNIPLNLTLTIAPTLLTLLLSTVFNTVQEFGTAVYRIANKVIIYHLLLLMLLLSMQRSETISQTAAGALTDSNVTYHMSAVTGTVTTGAITFGHCQNMILKLLLASVFLKDSTAKFNDFTSTFTDLFCFRVVSTASLLLQNSMFLQRIRIARNAERCTS